MWFIGVEVEQKTSAPPPKKNPGSAPAMSLNNTQILKVKQLQNRNKKDNNWQKINTTFSNTLSISGRSSAKETWL